jgi:phage terminase small subunit
LDLNATQAAIRAGYSPRTAAAQASRLLINVKVAEAIAQSMKERSRRLEVSKDRVLLELARIAMLDPGDLFDVGGNLLPVHAMPEDARRSIASLEVFDMKDGPTVHRVKLVGKKGALDSLARHLGLFDQNRSPRDGRDVSEMSEEELIAIIENCS